MKNQRQKQLLRRILTVKELVLITLAVVCLAGLALEHFERLSTMQSRLLSDFELFVGLIFLADFGFELYFAKNRKKYWRTHWYFLIASVPVSSQFFEVVRSLWLLRLLRMFKVFAHLRYEHNTRLLQARRP